MIQVKGLVKKFGKTTALDALDMTVPRGSIYGLIGPNGAGKTTAMSVLSTLLLPDGGAAMVDGHNVVDEPMAVRGVIGYMPDFFGVYDGLKTYEYLDFFAASYYIPEAARKPLIGELLELVNLGDKYDSYVDLLSRGMKQRLALARCLIHDPKVLILDEPASGLDPRARAELKEIIKQLKHLDKTVLISSHILPELGEICDQVGIMESGRLIASGPVEEITATSKGALLLRIQVVERLAELADYIKTKNSVSIVEQDEGGLRFVFKGEARERGELLRDIVGAGWAVTEFSEVRRNLEEAFMAVTGEGLENEH
jgi:ABC-2 type transport system ATP-binding protein